MCKVYGYARISTKLQSLKRQEENIKAYNAGAEIYEEAYTGTKLDRPEFSKLLKVVKPGDTIVFDEISRMSREAEEGFQLYKKLYSDGINLVFLKERTLDTVNFKQTQQLATTGEEITDYCIDFVNGLLMKLAEQQIKAAFAAAQHEVDFLHKRVADGMRSRHAGAKISEAKTGMNYETAKSKEMKDKIRKMSKDFDGCMSDAEVIGTLKIARNSYYKYKKELRAAAC